MHQLRVTLRFATPAILVGFDQSNAELRIPSILGMIRQWWRAQNYQVTDSHRLEAAIFGAAAGSDGESSGRSESAEAGGQSVFSAVLTSPPSMAMQQIDQVFRPGSPERKLLGPRKQTGILPSGNSVTLAFYFRSSHARYAPQIARAAEMWGLLGGIGTGQRRGFGSVSVDALAGDAGWTAPSTLHAVADRIRSLLPAEPARSGPLPDFVTLGPRAKVWAKEVQGDAKDALRAYAELTASFAGRHRLAPSDLFSEQSVMRNRLPSPLHVHVHPLAGTSLLVMSLLPTKQDVEYQPAAIARIEEFVRDIDATPIHPEPASRG
jgi:hypothetical protein